METNETIPDEVMKDVDGQLKPLPPKKEPIQPSVAEVYFYEEDVSLPYYTDRFDLKEGDTVFVDGAILIYLVYSGIVNEDANRLYIFA